MDESGSSDLDQSPPKKSLAAATASASSLNADVRVPKSYLKYRTDQVNRNKINRVNCIFSHLILLAQNRQYTGNRSWQFIHKYTKSDINLPRLDIKVL